jgi:hypothetical protein
VAIGGIEPRRSWIRNTRDRPGTVEEVVTLFAPAGDDGDEGTEAVFVNRPVNPAEL